MKHFLLPFLVMITFWSEAQLIAAEVDKDIWHPMEYCQDSLTIWCEIDALDLYKAAKTEAQQWDLYYYESSLFSGWASQIFEDTEHRFRYTRYENGKLVRQIGYFENGRIGHDFYQRDGKSIGSERMWHSDGHLYIDYFYSSPGVLHGVQKRWYSNHQLAEESVYNNGILMSKKSFDTNGNWVTE